MIHAFIVTKNMEDKKSLQIAEASGDGIRKDTLTLGQGHSTHFFLFKPKDKKLRDIIALNASINTLEAERNSKNDPNLIIPYSTKGAALAPFKAQFSTLTSQEKKELSKATAYSFASSKNSRK